MIYQATRSYSIKINPNHTDIPTQINICGIYEVLDGCMLMAKNVYNSSLFLLLNLHSSYAYNKETKQYHLKEKLHDNELEVVKLYQQAIADYNLYKTHKFNQKLKPEQNNNLNKENI